MVDTTDTASWIGSQEAAEDVVSQSALDRFSATFDSNPGVSPGPLACWLFFLPRAAQAELDTDGHPRKGGFLPPIELPRRMWAGGALRFHAPLEVGASITRVSTISAVEQKTGRSGKLAFVTVDHEIRGTDGPLVSERQSIVYREKPNLSGNGQTLNAVASLTVTPPEPSDWSGTVMPDTALLMRYSALTFNAHKIHYDRDYATKGEGYPGLVVHGPLLATLLLEQYRANNPDSQVAAFSFRALAPIFDTGPVTLAGSRTATGARLWATGADGNVGISATVTEP